MVSGTLLVKMEKLEDFEIISDQYGADETSYINPLAPEFSLKF
jgi:hypothetical protein